MKFALMMNTKPAESRELSDEGVKAIEARHAVLLEELSASGEIVNGAGLRLPEETVTVRAASTSTGPVASGDEHVTAYYVVEVADRQRAEEIAARILDDHVSAVEVRQIHNSNGM